MTSQRENRLTPNSESDVSLPNRDSGIDSGIDEQAADESLETNPPKEPTSSERQPKSGVQKYWWLLPILGLLVVVAGVTFVRLQEDEPTATSETMPLSVRTVIAQQQPIRAWVSSEGNVRAEEFQHLTFESEGEVTYIAERDGRRLREGDYVSAGDLLARIDDRQLVADVRQAEATVAEARQQRAAAAAQVTQAETQVAQAQAQVQEAQSRLQTAQSARDLAATNLERYRALVNQGAVPQLEFDQRQNSLDDAEAQVQSAQAAIASAQQQVTSARAQVDAARQQLAASDSTITTAQARLSQARVALEGASIYAPFDGVIAYLNVSEGEYFTPQVVTSQLGGDYQGILERIPMVIIDPAQYEVLVDLAGPTGEQVRTGQEALVASEGRMMNSSDTIDGQALVANARAKGEVFAVNPAISPGGRAIEARVLLNPSTTDDLRHGEQVLTWIAVDQNASATVVPLNAVVRRDQIPYVFVVDAESGTVEQRQVELGITGITQQAIASGVAAGDQVVTEGQNRLVDGAAVQIVNAQHQGAL